MNSSPLPVLNEMTAEQLKSGDLCRWETTNWNSDVRVPYSDTLLLLLLENPKVTNVKQDVQEHRTLDGLTMMYPGKRWVTYTVDAYVMDWNRIYTFNVGPGCTGYTEKL